MSTLAFIVPGRAAPQGSKRHVGKGVLVESSKRVGPWRELAVIAARNAILANGWERIEKLRPVSVDAIFTFDPPASLSAKRRHTWWPTTRTSGDVDKLARALLDAITTAGVIADDSQVVDLRTEKIPAGPGGPEASVLVRTLEPELEGGM